MKDKTMIGMICAIVLMGFGYGCATHIETESPSEETTTEFDEQIGTHISALLGIGSPCTADSQCATGVCNTFTRQCAQHGGVGTACNRDFECVLGIICNTFTHRCAFLGGIGTSCNRDIECSTGVCNTFTHQCAQQGGVGTGCNRDFECALGTFCNTITHQCSF